MTRVIKVGGRPQSDPRLGVALASGWARSNGGFVLVHGGGDEVSTLQAALGGSATFVNGRRVTTEKDIDLVRMALSGSANKRLVSSLVQNGIDAVGLSGEDAALIAATPMDAELLGFVGVPTGVNVAFLRHLLSGGYLPVISPVSRDGTGTLGAALNVIRDLTAPAAEALVKDGTIVGGMQAKLQAALSALAGGVPCVRISDIAAIVDLSRGTILRGIGELS